MTDEMETRIIWTPDNETEFEVGVIEPRYKIMVNDYGDTQYVPVYDSKAVDFVIQCFKEEVLSEYDCIVRMTGGRRNGKSSLASQMALRTDPNFPLSNVAFRLPDFRDIMSNNPWGDARAGSFPQVISDEAGYALHNKNWMKAQQKEMARQFQVFGMKNQIIYLCLPHMTELDSEIRELMSRYWIDVIRVKGKRGFALFQMGIDNRFKKMKYWQPLFVFHFPKLESDWWDAYQDKKKIFINEVLAEDIEKEQSNRGLDQRNILIKECHRLGMTEKAIGNKIGVDQSRISKIINAPITSGER